ncbi:hypothetical protein P3X46_032417 [Hevea brasiliensis]|uniref:Uncharacterized protein n=1 Tax=Hevea brasiliensis TaxID=3981 RepID=A0ABQ9KD89_HEVBR|nr:transcription factor MYB35 isoform X1 [Hevea brasiliensis]KAJ9135208.1 hypothetical protein P3X46_032417 [Hevea brasiliensis]
MGRPPCCDKSNVKRGLWTAEEDAKILAYVSNHGIGNWTLVPKKAGLNRCGKSCRLRWTNYLRPDLKHDNFTPQEEELIINLHKAIGSRWSLIARQLPGRTDNDVKNYWNTKLRKKLYKMGIDPVTHKPFSQILSDYGNIRGISNNTGNDFASFNKNFNSNLTSKPEQPSSSVLTGPSSSNVILTPPIEQVQENSFTNNSRSWELLPQFHVTNHDILQPHLINVVSSSCSSSSSSSTTVTQLNSPQSYTCQQSQTPITHSSPSLWSEFLLSDPGMSLDFQQQQQEQDSHGALSSTSTQNDISHDKFTGGNEDFGPYDHGIINGNQTNSHVDAYSSSASSFVAGILDKDREMRSQFPQLLDPSFDY